MSKEEFKLFARKNPSLAEKVLSGQITWQKLYEMFDIYGENSSVWNSFFPISKDIIPQSTLEPSSFKDFFNTFKNIDMDSVQKGVTNLQKTVGLLQEIGLGSKEEVKKNNYEPRPLYKYFED